MKKIFLQILLLFFAFFCYSQVSTIDQKALGTKLSEIFEAWGDVPALGIAVVQNNEIAFEKGYGVLETGKKTKANENTNFAIASNTKAFTAAALAILVDEGRISWDDKVRKYIPYFELYNPYVSNEMTIIDLLCHRSGLKTFSGDLIWYGSDHSREEVIKRAKYLEPVYGFREKYGYSNILYLTAGQIVEAVTDTTWDDFLKHRIFTPLGMNRTNTSVSVNEKLDNVAACHSLVNGKPVAIPYISWDNIAPAGSINSNVHDISKWMMLQLNKGEFNGKRIYSEKVSNEMWTAYTPKAVRPVATGVESDTHLKSYGLGWELYDFNGYLIVTHNGGYDGMISQTVLIPELNTGFVVLTNSLSIMFVAVQNTLIDYLIKGELSSAWSDRYLRVRDMIAEQDKKEKEEWEKSKIEGTSPAHNFKDYTGVYMSDVYGAVEISLTADGSLYLKMMHTPDYQGKITHWHYDTFMVKFDRAISLPEGTVNFISDKYGKVVELQIDIPNPDFDFTELKLIKQNN
ncbi:MAG: serine hydrolase [Bacteroidales bacterium]|jgi:CubicO group peptidase (beta-lactamase class C family)|nr:serine hydrolase [Bacteroidales bacterium]